MVEGSMEIYRPRQHGRVTCIFEARLKATCGSSNRSQISCLYCSRQIFLSLIEPPNFQRNRKALIKFPGVLVIIHF